MSIPTAILEARRLGKCYRQGTPAEVWALADVSLAIPSGSFAVLTGPSGSGKSTLLALLGALDRPTRGEVWFAGRSLHGCSDVELARVRRRMGFVFQDFALIPRLPAWDNVTYPLVPRGVNRRERYARARTLLERVGLADKADRRADELSGGEQQRVAVARALVGEPVVLFADEPMSNLDAAAAAEVLALFRAIYAGGTTVVLATHDRNLESGATQVFELEGGRLKARQGTEGDLPA